MSSPSSTNAAPKRSTRAKQACRNCNSRRVRCNVLETKPCHNCAAAQVVCEVLPSRRGKYLRRRKQDPPNSRVSYTTPPPLRTTEPFLGDSESTRRHYAGDANDRDADGADHQIVEDSISATPLIEPPSTQSAQVPVGATQVADTQAIDRTLFFGESNFLTCVAGSGFERPQPQNKPAQLTNRLVYPIADAINTKTSKNPTTKSNLISSARYNFLQSQNALTFPSPHVRLDVLRAYFRWFHPCFPVLDRAEIARTVESDEISPLLLQAILFVGASYCDGETIQKMGFKDHPDAKAQHYQRARLLYDADWESNKVTVLQALFLMSFWRAGPLNEKNTRYWLGSAISLAQTRGFHRAVHTSTIGVKQAKMRRRIWWSIYVRDRQASASLGLPSRIRDDDCDIEMINASDLDEIGEPISDTFGTSEPVHVIYVLEMVKLARLLGKIMTNQFTPGKSHHDQDERSGLSDALLRWKSELPENLRECRSEGGGPGMLWTYLLHLYYNNLQILLHRRAYVRLQDQSDALDGEIALQAASRITRIVEDMISQDLLRFGQLHVITCLFSSLCMHAISLQRSKDTTRRLAENRAQMCLIGLKEMQKYWEVNNLVLELFFQYIDESTAKTLRPSEVEVGSDTVPADDGSSILAMQASSVAEDAASALCNDDQGLHTTAGLEMAVDETLLSDTPQSVLCQNITSDPFEFLLDSQARINDGLDMQGLQFLHRCL